MIIFRVQLFNKTWWLQIEGAFVQGIGFLMLEDYTTNPDGLVVSNSTWSYKIPTIDTIPKQINVEIHNSGHHKNRVLSSKGTTLMFSRVCERSKIIFSVHVEEARIV